MHGGVGRFCFRRTRMKILSNVLLALSIVAPAVAAGSVYYVAPNGSDSGPGTPQRPLRTVAAAAERVGPGDRVMVNPGVYRESVALNRSGQPDARIMFRGLPGAVLTSPDPTRSLSAFDISSGTAFITLEGFELGGGFAETVFVRPGAHDIELAGLYVHDNHSGIWIAGAADVFVHDCRIDRNYRSGIRIYAGARRIRIVDTSAEGNDDGLGCDGASDGFNTDASAADIIFERVSAIGNSQDGFDLKAPNVAVLGAVARDNGCSGVKVWAGSYLENALLQGNQVGVNVGAPAGAVTVLQNCTLVYNALGVRALSSTQTVLIRNSIIAGEGKAISYASPVQLIEDHNILYRPDSTERLIERIEPGKQALYSGDDINGGGWQRESGQGRDTIAVEPQIDPVSAAPRRDSPALDSGALTGSPPIDLCDTQRPQGSGVDRGAVEVPLILPTLAAPAQKRGVRLSKVERPSLRGHRGSAPALWCAALTARQWEHGSRTPHQ